jgi:hypothetical protein
MVPARRQHGQQLGQIERTGQEVDATNEARVVLAVLRARQGVNVELHAQAVLAAPLERLEDVLPADALQEGLALLRLDEPVRDRQADPVQACSGNVGKVTLGLRKGVSGKIRDAEGMS